MNEYYLHKLLGIEWKPTRREYFAALAMQGLCAGPEPISLKPADIIAEFAVEQADALIAALEAKPSCSRPVRTVGGGDGKRKETRIPIIATHCPFCGTGVTAHAESPKAKARRASSPPRHG